MATSIASMAWRNLWRNRRRTLITLSSIAFGTVVAILFTAMGDANFGEMIDLAARLGGGHVSLQHRDYLEQPTFGNSLQGAARLREIALADPEVEKAVPRISGNLMVSSAGRSQAASFVAFDPAAEDTKTFSLLEAVSQGRVFAHADDHGVILGAGLADELHAGLGRKVVYTLTDKHGEIVQEAARVVGVVRTGAPSVDRGLCLLPLERVRRLLGYAPDETLQLALFLRDPRAAGDVARRLAPRVAPAAARPWYEARPELAGFIEMKVVSARILEGIILVLVAAGIFDTLFMSVMERLREFGILLAIGFSPGRLFGLVMCESLWLAAVGLASGIVLTVAPYWYLSAVGLDLTSWLGTGGSEVAGVAVTPVLRAAIHPDHAVAILGTALAATLLSGLYPAWSAGRISPVESLRIV